MGALVRVNGGIEKGQWGRWSGSMGAWRRVRSVALGQTGVWLWSDRGVVAVGQTGGCLTGLYALPFRVVSSTLQGCKLYLTGLQALPCRVVSSTLQGCKLYTQPYRVGSSTLQGCNLYLTGLQALPYRVASSTLQGCKLYHARL